MLIVVDIERPMLSMKWQLVDEAPVRAGCRCCCAIRTPKEAEHEWSSFPPGAANRLSVQGQDGPCVIAIVGALIVLAASANQRIAAEIAFVTHKETHRSDGDAGASS